MKKLFVLLISFFCFSWLGAQQDSSHKLRISGLQLGMNVGFLGGYKSFDLQDLQKLMPNDPLLFQDFSGFDKYRFTGSNFSAGFGFRIFAQVPARRIELSLGVIGTDAEASSLTYTKKNIVVSDIYVSQQGKDTLLKVRELTDYYNFRLNSSIVYIPFGIHLHTRKDRYIWAAAGLELAPGMVRYTYYSDKSHTEYVATVAPSTPTNNYYRYYDYQGGIYTGNSNSKGLSGSYFTTYLSVPFSVNARFSKKIRIIKNIHLHAEVAPVFCYTASKYQPSPVNGGFRTELGLRFAW
jgi:hypothetical protein